jgi:hypothetical protein
LRSVSGVQVVRGSMGCPVSNISFCDRQVRVRSPGSKAYM